MRRGAAPRTGEAALRVVKAAFVIQCLVLSFNLMKRTGSTLCILAGPVVYQAAMGLHDVLERRLEMRKGHRMVSKTFKGEKRDESG